jgi:hypothetical protein
MNRFAIYRTIPSNRFLNHLTVSSRLILWEEPTWVLHRRRLATRSPGRVLCLVSTISVIAFTPFYLHAAVEIHSVNTNRRVVLDTKIDVFADTEAEVASLREVALSEFVFLDLQSTLQDFLSLWSTDCDVHSNLLITTDTKRSDGVSGLACGN